MSRYLPLQVYENFVPLGQLNPKLLPLLTIFSDVGLLIPTDTKGLTMYHLYLFLAHFRSTTVEKLKKQKLKKPDMVEDLGIILSEGSDE
jgi:hypothetical protein